MMTPGPITLLATIADEQAAAGLPLALGAIAAMVALRDLIKAQPWAREPSQAVPVAKVAKARKATRAKPEPRPGSCAARDLAEARSWKAAGDARGASLERAILRCAREEQEARDLQASRPFVSKGSIVWLDGEGKPCAPPENLRDWIDGKAGLAEWDWRALEAAAGRPALRSVA